MRRIPDDHIITPDDAVELIRRGACEEGAKATIGMTVAEAVRAQPWAALKYAADDLTDAQFAKAAENKPMPALAYATDRYIRLMEAAQ